ncbi:MAG TPA: hypothetical protein VFV54_01500 [Thermoanaerobaculia bacterium]|nr:hypothetical protein [Thermoanaerobaculia bacterium]
MRWIPTPAEERAMALRTRARGWMRAGWITEAERKSVETTAAGDWKVFSLLPRIGLFILLFNATSTSRIFFGMQPNPGTVLVGLAIIGLAEVLIVKARFFRTGIEEGIWCAGLLLLLFDAFAIWESSMLFAAWFGFAAGIATILLSLRLLHTLLFLAGVAFLVFWAGDFFDTPAVGGWLLFAAGLVALAVHLRPAARPFRASASGWLALVAPAVAWALLREDSVGVGNGIALGSAILWLGLGTRHRSRFAIAGGALAVMAFGYQLLESARWAVEWKLILGGAAVFGLAVALERWLRTPRGGFTSRALDSDAEPALFEMAAVAALAPAAAQREGFESEGGKFGGAGSSGDW